MFGMSPNAFYMTKDKISSSLNGWSIYSEHTTILLGIKLGSLRWLASVVHYWNIAWRRAERNILEDKDWNVWFHLHFKSNNFLILRWAKEIDMPWGYHIAQHFQQGVAKAEHWTVSTDRTRRCSLSCGRRALAWTVYRNLPMEAKILYWEQRELVEMLRNLKEWRRIKASFLNEIADLGMELLEANQDREKLTDPVCASGLLLPQDTWQTLQSKDWGDICVPDKLYFLESC